MQDLRRIAEALISGSDKIPRPTQRKPVCDWSRIYAEAIGIMALRRLEKWLEGKNLTVKDAIAILEAVRRHAEWARSIIKKRRASGTAPTGAPIDDPIEPDWAKIDRQLEVPAEGTAE